jgi:hypothetical protein
MARLLDDVAGRLKPFRFRVVGGAESIAPHIFYSLTQREAEGYARTWAEPRGLKLELVEPKATAS